MSTTSKSPPKVLLAAHAAAKEALPEYAHRNSPKKFTQHQLFACLVLKAFHKVDYRGIEAILADAPALREAIDMKRVPHFTTLHKAEMRLLKLASAARLLEATITLAIRAKCMKRRVLLAAVDGTGFETRHISSYYVSRRRRCQEGYETTSYTRFPKAGILCDCASHMILSVVAGRGPGPDIQHFRKALSSVPDVVGVETILADAGYDSEASHVYAREDCGMRSVIPPKIGRPTAKLPSGRWRRVMAARFDKQKYGQRWQCETVNSMIKRLLGSALRARTYWRQCREITLRAITLNVMILWRPIRGFLQSIPDPVILFILYLTPLSSQNIQGAADLVCARARAG